MNKIIIIAGGFAVIVVLAAVLVWPQCQKLQIVNSEIKNKETEFNSQKLYFAQIKEASEKLSGYSDVLSKISDALPKDPSLASLVNFLQANSSETGLLLKRIALSGTTAPNKARAFAETRVIMQISGSYDSFNDFLKIIENSARIIEVESISVDIPSEKSGNSPEFILNLKANSY